MKMKSVMCLAAVLLMAGFLNAATLRYQGSGDWFDIDISDGNGWQGGVLPGAADTARANWGGWTGNTITLNGAAPTITAFNLGVDESGALVVGAGGSITSTGNDKVGNNNWVTGKLVINAGGTVTNNSWFGVANGNGGTKTAGWDPLNPTATWGPTTGIVEINGGTLNILSHLWCTTGGANTSAPVGAPTCVGTININAGGVINVSGNIGLGTINGSDQSAGKGITTLNVNDGGTLNLSQWSDWNLTTNKGSIQPGSVLNISGTGKVVINGNKVASANTYVSLGRITAYGGTGTIIAVFNSATNKTTITAISRMAPSPANGSTVAEGTVSLGWKNIDPNEGTPDVYVDVWFGSDNTWIPEPNELLSGYPGYYVDFAKVLVASQNATTFDVSAPVIGIAPTTYYWRVDSYIYGDAHIGDPNFPVVEGDMFLFDVTNDFAPTVVVNTPNTLTWANKPVQLDATVTDTGSSALTIAWTSNPAGAVFTPSAAVEDPVVTFNPAAFPTTVTLTCSVKDGLNPQTNTAATQLVVYADACTAARRTGAPGIPATDVDGDCDTDLTDLFALLSDWTTDYTILTPMPIP